MTEPLLTIDEATRTFRTSPKTIRRRLVAGEIAGAYKRPGDRGPEWVMTPSSLDAAGFVRRSGVDGPGLPTDPASLVSYWERRAVDAEAARASQAAPMADAPAPRGRARAVLVLAGLALLVVGFLAGQLTATDSGAADPDSGVVRTLLLARTQSGDGIGMVGEVPDTVVPAGRSAVRLDPDGLERDLPRYVVAQMQDGWSPPAVEALRSGAALVLSMPVVEGTGMEVFDTAGMPVPDAIDDPVGDRASEDAPPAPTTAPTMAEESAHDSLEPTQEPLAADAPPQEELVPPGVGGTVTVTDGDSFWSIASAMVSDSDAAGDLDLHQYWSLLVSANADALVEPGNPDLLHVGQVLVLPGAP